MFRKESRAEKLKRQAEQNRFVPTGALAGGIATARPVVERLLYDDELRDDIREFMQSASRIADHLSDGDAREIVNKLWDDDKVRTEIENATERAQTGVKRVRGEKVKSKDDLSFGTVLLGASALVAFLMLNPKTGPAARQYAKNALGAVR
jgi:hypothetical protein